MWSYIIDGLIIAIIVVSAIIGIAKGFFDSLLSLIGTGVALAVAVFTAKYVSAWLNKIINIEGWILGKLDASNGGTVSFFDGKFSYTNAEVAKFCVWIVTVLVLFLIIKLAIFILAKIFESVVKSSTAISGLNRVFGMFFGVAKGVVWVAVTLALCSALAQVPVIGAPITEKINSSKIGSFAYKYVDDFVETQLTKEKIDGIIAQFTGTGETPTETPSDTPTDTPTDTPADTPSVPAE